MRARLVPALGALAALVAVLFCAYNVESAAARVALPLAILAFVALLAYAAAGGPGAFSVGGAMLRQSFLTYRSYRAQVVAILAYTALTVVLLYVAAGPAFRLMLGIEGGEIPRQLIAFLTVGLVTWPLFWKAWEVTALGVRQEQWQGTLESLIPTPRGTSTLPLGYLMSRIPFTFTFHAMGLTAIMLAFPGALRLQSPQAVLDFVAVAALAVACMWGLGLLFGGLAILYKQLGPVDLVVRTLFLFLAGVFLPIEVFPAWAQALSKVLPVTHAYQLLHFIAVEGAALGESPTPLVILLAFTTLTVTVGSVVYRAYVEKARRQGAIQGY